MTSSSDKPYYAFRGGPFSNFAPCTVVGWCGRWFDSTEAAYQAAKFDEPGIKNAIRDADGPKEAKLIARHYAPAIRPKWDTSEKLTVMDSLLEQKFSQPYYRRLLLATGNKPIFEIAPWDAFWGCDSVEQYDGRWLPVGGVNHLGRLIRLQRELILLDQ